jgi:hypothetical protein
MSDEYHAVHSVSAAGVFDSWASARLHVDRVEGAVHRSFLTEQEARDWLAMHQAPSPAAYDDEDGEQTPSAPLAEYLPYMGHENKRKRDTARGGADMGFSGYLLDGQEDLGLVRAAEPLSGELEAVVQVCLAGHNVLIAERRGRARAICFVR